MTDPLKPSSFPDGVARASREASVEFSVEVERTHESWCVVVLTGEIDMYTAPAVEGELLRAVEAGARDVTVQLTDATFIDSTFLGVLTAAHERLDKLGGRISIVCDNPNLTKVFEITGLDKVFAIHPTSEGAASQRSFA